MPDWPVNHSVPLRSNTAVFRFVDGRSSGRGKRRTSDVDGSTRTMAFKPPSVIHGAPSGSTMTPCGAEPSPSSTSSMWPLVGSRWPSLPAFWAVYQTVPSAATATSCGCDPLGTSYSCSAPTPDVAGASAPVVDGLVVLPSPFPDEHATAAPITTAAAITARWFIEAPTRTRRL